MSVEAATRRVVRALQDLQFGPPVAHVYNPLVHARRPHRIYVERFGSRPVPCLLLGMNPGPFGMVQTGVPFGEVAAVRDWLGIEAPVDTVADAHPSRPVLGFACPRSEVSGRRLWGWAATLYGTPGAFFDRFYVHNYCPLAFVEASGRNRTPDKLPAAERDPLFAICDRYLRDVVAALGCETILGVGAFAEQRARAVFADRDDLAFGRIPHPSPASPAANRGWEELADRAMGELGFGR